jgi:hypothetical protein
VEGSSGFTRRYPGGPNVDFARPTRLEPREEVESGGGDDVLIFYGLSSITPVPHQLFA